MKLPYPPLVLVISYLLTILVLKFDIVYYILMCLKECWMYANSVDPDQTPRSAASDLGLHCLQRPIREITVNARIDSNK